ncbi:MAG: patatin-like phospholipase family protein [Chloroflexota bacterium]
MADEKLIFVLSGGGSRGAMQVGALQALKDRGYEPDLMIGTSIGAVNSAFIAIHSFSQDSLDRLVIAWKEGSGLDLLPFNYFWLAMRSIFRNSANDPSHKIREFIKKQGMSEDLVFGSLQKPGLIVVSAEIETGHPTLHGLQPDENILDALLLSTALPPWVMPVKKQTGCIWTGLQSATCRLRLPWRWVPVALLPWT